MIKDFEILLINILQWGVNFGENDLKVHLQYTGRMPISQEFLINFPQLQTSF